MEKVKIPRIVIAGTQSGCGKTTIATGIMSALTHKGFKVQPFKVGPDFIDPTHHSATCGRPSRNLDPFMMGEDGVRDTFVKSCDGADIAVVEGVMGMYDGLEGTDTSSTAHVAKLLSAPVLLVVDVIGMSRSANALIKGYMEFDPSVDIAGVIFNRVGGLNHQRMIETDLRLPSLGWIEIEDALEIGNRHLGLRMSNEVNSSEFGGIIEKYVDIEGILALARDARPFSIKRPSLVKISHKPLVTIGIAIDPAFCFYYQDNLDMLSGAGARLESFSPIDERLPNVDGLYLGGGYPELHAPELELSRCRDDVKKAADDGMPIYAECGGLMYLGEDIFTDRKHKMAGVFSVSTKITSKIQALGYVEGECLKNGIFRQGIRVLGHEFHYSSIECGNDAKFAFVLSRGRGIMGGYDGLYEHNAVGGYTHVYFSPQFAHSIISAANEYKRT